MKITFDQQEILQVLSRVSSVAEKKTTMPILANVLLETSQNKLLLSATDLEIGVQSFCPVKVIQEGQICTPALNFFEIVKTLPKKPATLEKTDHDWLILTCDKAQFRIAGLPAEDFPQISSNKKNELQKISVEKLRSGIEKTFYAISIDEMRPALNGIFLETTLTQEKQNSIRMVTTDGHRLGIFTTSLQKEETFLPKLKQSGVILPKKGIVELRKLLVDTTEKYIDLSITDNEAVFSLGGTTIFMKLVVGDFPNYEKLVPTYTEKKLVLQKQHLLHALKRVSLLSETRSKCVRFHIQSDSIYLTAISPELGEAKEDVSCEYNGQELRIGFNAKYIIDALSVTSFDHIVINIDDDQSPMVIRTPEDEAFLAVIMPMRI